MWASTNPALANDDVFNKYYGKAMFDAKPNTATLQGVVNKTAILTLIAIAAGAGGYALVSQFASLLWISAIAAFVICLGVGYVVRGKPQSAIYLAPVYAIVEGVFLGAFTRLAEWLLLSRGIEVPGGVALQAFIITGSVLGAMLALYSMRILRPTRMLTAVVSTATLGIMLAYLLSFVLSFFGMSVPFIGIHSALNDTGMAGWIGLGVNLLILGIASLWLIIDFGMIEEKLSTDQPKYMEWYCGFALLVTLAWIYYESVKLVLRLASMFSRD
jgi:uncharacterized YccA/Bax inhibitor family protein